MEVIDSVVKWESFSVEIEVVVLMLEELRKSSAGRKLFDEY